MISKFVMTNWPDELKIRMQKSGPEGESNCASNTYQPFHAPYASCMYHESPKASVTLPETVTVWFSYGEAVNAPPTEVKKKGTNRFKEVDFSEKVIH